MGKCPFCKIQENEKERIIKENEFFFALFDDFPVSPGHTLIIPKRHVASFFKLREEEWSKIRNFVEKVRKTIESVDLGKIYRAKLENPLNPISKRFCQEALNHEKLGEKPDGYNIGVNEGKAAGRTIPHFHIHLIPRYKGDTKEPIGGVRKVIPGKGNYKQLT